MYLTFIHCTWKFEKHKQFSLVKAMNKLSIIKAKKKSYDMKSTNNLPQ